MLQRLEVSERDLETSEWGAELAAGRAIAFYVFNYATLKLRMKNEFPLADVWYTERNGDPIGLLVPHGTPPERLPAYALDYIVLEWIDPDKEFGTGVRVEHVKSGKQALGCNPAD